MYCRDCGKKVDEYCHSYRCVDCCIKWQEMEISYYKNLHDEENCEPEYGAIKRVKDMRKK